MNEGIWPFSPVLGSVAFRKTLGRDVSDVFTISDFSGERLKKFEPGYTFLKGWEKKYGRTPDFFSVMAYDATKMLSNAIREVEGRITGVSLREQLIDMKPYRGLLGDMSFTRRGEIQRPLFLYEWKEGKPILLGMVKSFLLGICLFGFALILVRGVQDLQEYMFQANCFLSLCGVQLRMRLGS